MVAISWLSVHFMRRISRASGVVFGLLLIPVVSSLIGVGPFEAGPVSAATLSVDPTSVAGGGSIDIEGGDWLGTVTLSFLKGNTVVQAGTAETGPNGGSITATRTVPNEPGAWQLCAQGMNLGDGVDMSVCVPFTITAPVTTTAAATSTAAPTTTTAETTLPPATVPPVSLAPVELPLGPDGMSDVDEETITKKGSGPSGLGIGLGVGIIAVTGLAVVGLASSGLGSRPRPRAAIAAGIVGVLVAGGTAVAVPPPKVNVPKLELSRVQTSAMLSRGSTLRTISADCPAGRVVIGGGFVSTWDSTYRGDLGYLINWLETETRNSSWTGSKTFVLPFNVTQVIRSVDSSVPTPPDGVASKYWNATRVDGTLHLSDQVWDSKQESAFSATERARRRRDGLDAGVPTFIPRSDAVVAAMSDYFYLLHDAQAPSRTDLPGLHVTQSKPERSSWVVTASLSQYSLMPQVSVTAVAVCAPDANNTDEPGVIGAHVIDDDGASSVSCPSGEVVTAAGWGIAPPGYVRAVRVTGSTVDVEGGAAFAVCVKAEGFATTSGSGRVDAKVIREGSGSAACPAGSLALSGALIATYTSPEGGVVDDLPQNVVAAAPVGSGFSVTMRGFAAYWPKAKAGAVGVDVDNAVNVLPYEQYEKLSTSSADITAICGRRVP